MRHAPFAIDSAARDRWMELMGLAHGEGRSARTGRDSVKGVLRADDYVFGESSLGKVGSVLAGSRRYKGSSTRRVERLYFSTRRVERL